MSAGVMSSAHEGVVDQQVDGVAVDGFRRERLAELLGEGEDVIGVRHVELSEAER